MSRWAIVEQPWLERSRTLSLLFVWDGSYYPPNTEEELKQAKFILALPFGSHKPNGGNAGQSNRLIGEIAANLRCRLPQLSVFSQWELRGLIPAMEDPGVHGRTTTTPSYLSELFQRRPEHLRKIVALISPGELGALGRKVILVAHPWHFPRAKKHLERIGFRVLVPPGISTIPWDSPEGTQEWVKSPKAWIGREVGVRLACRLLGSRLGPHLFSLNPSLAKKKTLVERWQDSKWL